MGGARDGFGLLLKCDGSETVSEPIGTKTRGFENSKCEESCLKTNPCLKDLKFLVRTKYSEPFSSSEECEW